MWSHCFSDRRQQRCKRQSKKIIPLKEGQANTRKGKQSYTLIPDPRAWIKHAINGTYLNTGKKLANQSINRCIRTCFIGGLGCS